MKRSRFTFQVTIGSPEPVVAPWPRPHTRFLHDFRPRAERYRRRKRIGLGLVIGFMVGTFLVSQLPLPEVVLLSAVLVLAACLFAGLIIFVILGFKLACPACRKRLEPATGLYCPICGSDEFRRGNYCPGCNNRILEADGDSDRSYRIRGCTHCGVLLDERGI